MNRQNVTKWCSELSEGRTDVHDEQRCVRPSFNSDNLLQEIEEEIRANRRVTIRVTTIYEAVTKIRVQKIVRSLGA